MNKADMLTAIRKSNANIGTDNLQIIHNHARFYKSVQCLLAFLLQFFSEYISDKYCLNNV